MKTPSKRIRRDQISTLTGRGWGRTLFIPTTLHSQQREEFSGKGFYWNGAWNILGVVN